MIVQCPRCGAANHADSQACCQCQQALYYSCFNCGNYVSINYPECPLCNNSVHAVSKDSLNYILDKRERREKQDRLVMTVVAIVGVTVAIAVVLFIVLVATGILLVTLPQS